MQYHIELDLCEISIPLLSSRHQMRVPILNQLFLSDTIISTTEKTDKEGKANGYLSEIQTGTRPQSVCVDAIDRSEERMINIVVFPIIHSIDPDPGDPFVKIHFANISHYAAQNDDTRQ